MESYSQYGEDRIVAEHLEPGAGHGAVLDIGAWHPITFSNSRMLIHDFGWSGVLIEPSPGPLAACVKEYGLNERVQVVGAAVSIESSIIRMHVTDDAVSTSSPEVHKVWKEAGGYIGPLWVPTITLEQISNQFGGFGVISIDTEGTSVDLAKRYLELGMRPALMIVEHDNRLLELLVSAEEHGYRAVKTNGTNVILAQ